MTKPSRETIRKRIATRRRNARIRKRKTTLHRNARLKGSEGPKAAARARLEIDGCNSDDAVRRRIEWFAHKHKLPPTEIDKAMTCRVDHIGAFAERDEISLDWLLVGDLKGSRRMPMKRSPAIFPATDVIRVYAGRRAGSPDSVRGGPNLRPAFSCEPEVE
jgi:hypothetical protein